MVDEGYCINLTLDQAIILFDWLARTSECGRPAGFKDQAEQRVMWDVEAELEALLVEPVLGNYEALLASAWKRVRDTNADGQRRDAD